MFSRPPEDVYIEVAGHHSPWLVILSVAIAAFATFTALLLYRRIQQSSFFHRRVWLVLISVAMGFGVWAMHFVGMNALWLPLKMTYHPGLTVVSIIPAIAASSLAFLWISRPQPSRKTRALAAAVMGLGISAMHFIGMVSIRMEAVFQVDRSLFILSIAVGILASYLAVSVFTSDKFPARQMARKLVTAVIMGFAISSVHFIAIAGTTFYADVGHIQLMPVQSQEHRLLDLTVTVGIVVLLLILFFASQIDRYVDYWMVNYDSLTKLPNRRSWEVEMESEAPAGDVAIWYFPDIHTINEEHGYKAGDRVLRQIGNFFAVWGSALSDIYRVSGNRFLLRARSVERTAEFRKHLEKMADMLRDGFKIDEHRVEVRTVCALAEADGGKSAKRLYSEAQRVLAHPSTAGESGIIPFDAELHGMSYEQGLLRDLQEAMEEDQLFLAYQPKVCSRTGSLHGVEALLRWHHPKHGLLPPGVFIPILESNGRIEEVTDWIIAKVCRQLKEWDYSRVHVPQVAINIPAEYMTKPRLLEELQKVVKRCGVEPGRIELEITETSVAESIEQANRSVQAFQRLGFSVALDDFGTGVSSLSYLRRLPITAMKIDKSFIDNIPADPKDSSILTAILRIGKTLDLQVVIEGVETKEQVAFLDEVDYRLIYQGYYFAKPMEAEAIGKWLDARREKSHELV